MAAPESPAAPEAFHVNEYITNRAYGGPEEGGWWYDTGTFVQCHGTAPTRVEAHGILETVRPDLDRARAGLHDPGSVLCTGWPDIHIEPDPGADYPTRRPRYA